MSTGNAIGPVPAQIALRCAWLLTCLLLAASVPNALGVSCWPCDLVSHFPAHLAAAAVLPAAVFAVVGRVPAVVVPAAVAVWNLLAFVPFYASAPAALAESPLNGRMIRVIALNVAAHNRDSQRVIGFIRATKPDVLVVTELNGFWAKAFAHEPTAAQRPGR